MTSSSVVDVHALCGSRRERRPFCRRLAAEVAQHQQTHRFAVLARTAAAAETEVELQTSWHQCLRTSSDRLACRILHRVDG